MMEKKRKMRSAMHNCDTKNHKASIPPKSKSEEPKQRRSNEETYKKYVRNKCYVDSYSRQTYGICINDSKIYKKKRKDPHKCLNMCIIGIQIFTLILMMSMICITQKFLKTFKNYFYILCLTLCLGTCCRFNLIICIYAIIYMHFCFFK